MIQPLRIAVADDEPDMRDFLKKVLERLGHVVLGPVENGVELVEICQANGPDLVITDIRMPQMDGDEALRRIQTTHPVPCIVISAFGNSDQWAFEMDKIKWTFLDKPFRKNDLHEAIRGLMSRHGN